MGLACLRESLRLNPPAAMRVVESVEDTTVCDGKFALKQGDRVAILACRCQTDPKIWGEDVSAHCSNRDGTNMSLRRRRSLTPRE